MDWKWRRLEKDWRWTDCGLDVDSMDEMGTKGGLHEDLWGSVRYSEMEGSSTYMQAQMSKKKLNSPIVNLNLKFNRDFRLKSTVHLCKSEKSSTAM